MSEASVAAGAVVVVDFIVAADGATDGTAVPTNAMAIADDVGVAVVLCSVWLLVLLSWLILWWLQPCFL